VQVDVDNLTTRIVMNFGFSLLNSAILFLINRRLLGQAEAHIGWVHELIRAGANTLVAPPIFFLLDLTKRPE
jgi:rod shape-determining protein MreD